MVQESIDRWTHHTNSNPYCLVITNCQDNFLFKKSEEKDHVKVMKDAELVYGEKYGYHTHYLPLQAAVDFLAEQFEMMQTASLTVDRDMTVCQCEYRKEGGET